MRSKRFWDEIGYFVIFVLIALGIITLIVVDNIEFKKEEPPIETTIPLESISDYSDGVVLRKENNIPDYYFIEIKDKKRCIDKRWKIKIYKIRVSKEDYELYDRGDTIK